MNSSKTKNKKLLLKKGKPSQQSKTKIDKNIRSYKNSSQKNRSHSSLSRAHKSHISMNLSPFFIKEHHKPYNKKSKKYIKDQTTTDTFYNKYDLKKQTILKNSLQQITKQIKNKQLNDSDRLGLRQWNNFLDQIQTTDEIRQLIESVKSWYQNYIKVANKNLVQENKKQIMKQPLDLKKLKYQEIKDYHDQFLEKQAQFSPSWRQLLKKDMQRFK